MRHIGKCAARAAGIVLVIFALLGCAGRTDKTTVTVFAAKSLNNVTDELMQIYSEEHPDIIFTANYDGSGTLKAQIEEGADCDIFFPAATQQMNELEEEGYVLSETRADIIGNRVCVVTYKGHRSKVTGLADLGNAESVALAAGGVPVGRYTREALIAMNILPGAGDAAAVTSEEISEALGGVPVNECANVGAVAAAVAEGSNEVGTVYYSDCMAYEDRLDIIEIVPGELTGKVICPIAGIVNPQATEAEREAALDFIEFMESDRAKEVFEKYYFDTDVR